MKTQVLLSSVTTLPFLESVFELARDCKFHGIELMPYRWTDPETVKFFSQKYDTPIKGIHLPFWWHTRSLRKVCASESELREKFFACVWWVIFGPGHANCSAIELAKKIPEAYYLIHPDAFIQAKDYSFLRGREVFFENERPKIGEGQITYDPQIINQALASWEKSFRGQLMFDSGHIQIAQRMEKFPEIAIHKLYRKLRPAGLHMSFSGEGRLHDLPSDEEWQELVRAIKEFPPQYIVIETKPGPGSRKRVEQAREMIWLDLGI